MGKSREYRAVSITKNEVIHQGRFDGATPGEILGKVKTHLSKMVMKGVIEEGEKVKVEILKKRTELIKGRSRIADAWTVKARGDKQGSAQWKTTKSNGQKETRT